jgi:hypothetical protein
MSLNLTKIILNLTWALTIFEKYHTKFDEDMSQSRKILFNNF